MQTTTTPSTAWARPDSPLRYGTVSRALHWVMALCFALVFAAAVAHFAAEDSAVDKLLWPVHKPVGVLLLLLVLLRAGWSLFNTGRRPPSVNRAAHLGHRLMYVLMLVIPTIGLVRQYGSGRAFAPFGLPLIDARPDDKIEWMQELGGALHGELGWVLLACIAGHVGMAFWHRRHPQHNVLPRMTD